MTERNVLFARPNCAERYAGDESCLLLLRLLSGVFLGSVIFPGLILAKDSGGENPYDLVGDGRVVRMGGFPGLAGGERLLRPYRPLAVAIRIPGPPARVVTLRAFGPQVCENRANQRWGCPDRRHRDFDKCRGVSIRSQRRGHPQLLLRMGTTPVR